MANFNVVVDGTQYSDTDIRIMRERIVELEAEAERLQAERKGMIDENPGDAYWKTAPHDELLNALLFQGGTTKALLQQTEEQQAEIERLRNERDAWRGKCLKIQSTAERLWGEDWDVDLMDNAAREV